MKILLASRNGIDEQLGTGTARMLSSRRFSYSKGNVSEGKHILVMGALWA